MTIIYHLIGVSDWETAKASGEVRPESLAAEGFIHCSENEDQALRVVSRLYAGRDDMLLLDVCPENLDAPVKREPSRSGEMYPHIYGPLNTNAVMRVRTIEVDANGNLHLTGG